MPRRKIRYPEKPWIRDPEVVRRFQELIDKGKPPVKCRSPDKPVQGWQLWHWDTLQDVPQD